MYVYIHVCIYVSHSYTAEQVMQQNNVIDCALIEQIIHICIYICICIHIYAYKYICIQQCDRTDLCMYSTAYIDGIVGNNAYKPVRTSPTSCQFSCLFLFFLFLFFLEMNCLQCIRAAAEFQ